MERGVIILILVSVLASCSLEKRLAKYCPLCPTETATVTEYRDTTVEVMVPGDSFTVIDSLYCDSLGNVYSERLYEKDSKILSLKARLKNNRYTVDCESDTVIVERTVPGVNKIVREVKKVRVPFTPWYMKALAFVGGLILLLLVLYITWKILRK